MKVIWRIVTASEMSVQFITVRIDLKTSWMEDNLLYCSVYCILYFWDVPETSLKKKKTKKNRLNGVVGLLPILDPWNFHHAQLHVSSIKVIQHSQSREQHNLTSICPCLASGSRISPRGLYLFSDIRTLEVQTTELRGGFSEI